MFEQARRCLYPIMEEKIAYGCQVKLVRDVLYVDDVVYDDNLEEDAKMTTKPKTYSDATKHTPVNRPTNKRRQIFSTSNRNF